MPTDEPIQLDPAVRYVVDSGTLRIRTDTEEWQNAAKEDITKFINAIANASPKAGDIEWSLDGNPPDFIENKAPSWGTIVLRSNTSIPLGLTITASNNALWLNFYNGSCHYNIQKGFTGAASISRAYHWIILKGINGEICVVIGRSDEQTDLLKNYESPNGYSAPPPTELRNNLCKYTKPSFYIVHVMDSFTNNTGYSAFLIPHGTTGTGTSTPYDTDDEFKEFATYIDISTLIADRYFTSDPSGVTGYMPMYYLLAGDHMYYARNHSEIIGSVFSYSAPIYYLTAVASPISRCVSCTTLMEAWGNKPDPNGLAPGLPHLGPELIEIGPGSDLRHYIRSGNIFMPVTAPVDPEPDPEDDD